jgi:hypothetical protein
VASTKTGVFQTRAMKSSAESKRRRSMRSKFREANRDASLNGTTDSAYLGG